MSTPLLTNSCPKDFNTNLYENTSSKVFLNGNDVLLNEPIETSRIKNVFNQINDWNCGKIQLTQLKKLLEESKASICFDAGDAYSCSLQIIENLPKIILKIPQNPQQTLFITYVELPCEHIEDNFFGLDVEMVIEKEKVEAYLLGHEIFHAISFLNDYINEKPNLEQLKDFEIKRGHNFGIKKFNVSSDKLSKFFGGYNADDAKNLFGLGELSTGENIIGEYHYLNEILPGQKVRFPYSQAIIIPFCIKKPDLLKKVKLLQMERYKEMGEVYAKVFKEIEQKDAKILLDEYWGKNSTNIQKNCEEANEIMQAVYKYHNHHIEYKNFV